ncbi:MAG: hypothetical protein H7174_13990 [Flavobacterium sp.]|nr:hypothetical protein [Flavobacterium sp.]
MKSIVSLLLLVFVFQLNAQQNLNQKVTDNTVVMTWNKNTPEQEMKDDIKALKTNNGVTIKYSNLKRNSKNEITNLKIEYADNEGNSGSQEYKNKNAIPEIKFYKINGEIGFGNPDNQSFVDNGMAFQNFDLKDLQNQFSNKIKIDTLGNNKTFTFDFNDDDSPKIKKKSKIIIQKDGRKPLVIEDGKVVEGEKDYTKDEIEKILNDNKINDLNDKKSLNFNFNGNDFDMKNLQEQIEKLQNQFQNRNPKFRENEVEPRISKPSSSDKEDLKKEMRDARDEMIKAKKELEDAKKEIQKSKSEMKTQRI